MNSLLNLIQFNCKAELFLLPKSRLILASSAGQDSTLLYICFLILQSQWSFLITTIYCNHLWQKESSQLILHLLDFYYLTHVDFITTSTIEYLPNERSSRIWRYNLIERLAFFNQSKFILLGHSKSDQLESFILNLLRGSGSNGLTSLSTRRSNYFPKFRCFSEKKQQVYPIDKIVNKYNTNFKSNKNISILWVLRPLLKCNRYEVSMLVYYHRFPVWTDKTNFYMEYNRNRIRFELLPLMRFYFNQSLDFSILRCSQILNQELEFIQSLTYSALKYSLVSILDNKLIIHNKTFFYALPYIFQKRIILESLKILKLPNITFQIIQRILKIILLFHKMKKANPQIFKLQHDLLIISYCDFFIIYSKS